MDGQTKTVRGAVGVDARRPAEGLETDDEVCAALRGARLIVEFLGDGEHMEFAYLSIKLHLTF